MTEFAAGRTLSPSLADHPAVQAWSVLKPERMEPSRITVLYDVRKTQVYRLEGVGPERSSIIAKRCRRRSVIAERMVYEEILPRLPINYLRYFGSLEEEDGKFCCLFLEDAVGEDYCPEKQDHRELAASWIASMHTSASGFAGDTSLPREDSPFYRRNLQAPVENMEKGLSNPVLTKDHVALVRATMLQLSVIEKQWPAITELCDRMPHTLIHGDLALRNVRVRGSQRDKSLLVMDWNHAAWGTPAIDLLQAEDGTTCLRPDLEVYQSAVFAIWPHLSMEDLRYLAFFGRIFRLISAIKWTAESLSFWWVDGELKDLARYEQRLRLLIASPQFK